MGSSVGCVYQLTTQTGTSVRGPAPKQRDHRRLLKCVSHIHYTGVCKQAQWCSGITPASRAGGTGFDSRSHHKRYITHMSCVCTQYSVPLQ